MIEPFSLEPALQQLLEGVTAGSPPPSLMADTPTGTMEDQVEQDEVLPSSPNTSVYSVKSAPVMKSISRNLLRRSPKSDKKSVHSDGNRRRTKKVNDTTGGRTAYVALTDNSEESSSGTTKKAVVVNSSPQEEVAKRQHLSKRSVCSDGDRRRQPRKKTAVSKFMSSSGSSAALSLPGQLSPSGKSAVDTLETPLRLLLNPSSSSEDGEESFYSANGFPASSPLDTRAEVERLVHCIMPEEDPNVETMMERFRGRETVLLQTLLTLYDQQTTIESPKKKQSGEASNCSTPSGLLVRGKFARITRTGSSVRRSKPPRSLDSLLCRHNDNTPQSHSSQKENDGDGEGAFLFGGEHSLRNRKSSASFGTPRGSTSSVHTSSHSKDTSNSTGADVSLVVNPGSIGSVLRRFWGSTGDLVEVTTSKKNSAAASHRTDPGHRRDGNIKENALAGPKSVSGGHATKEGRELAIEFALETGDWGKVEQVGAGVSDNSVSTISTDSEILLGMDEQVEMQLVFEENELARGSPPTLSVDTREMLAHRIEDCASQLDAVIEEDDWSAVMEIINKYTRRDNGQTIYSQDEVASGQDVTNETMLNENSCASISIGTQEGDKESSKKAVEESIETESRETSLLVEEAAEQDVELTTSGTLDLSAQKADDQGCCERRKLVLNGGSNQSGCSCGGKNTCKHTSKDKLQVKKKTVGESVEESVEIYMKESQQEKEEKSTITGMSFDVQPKEDLSLLSMNSAGQSNYSNPQSELIGKLKKAIKSADWNEVQILGQSLETGDIDGIAAIRIFKTLKKNAPAGESELTAQDEDKYVQIAMSGSSQQWENQDHDSMSMKVSREEERTVTGRGSHESHVDGVDDESYRDEVDDDDKSYLDGVVDDNEEGMETVLPDQAQAKPTGRGPRELQDGDNEVPMKPSTSNVTSQQCTCNCVIS